MNVELPPSGIGERNSENAPTLDRVLTHLK